MFFCRWPHAKKRLIGAHCHSSDVYELWAVSKYLTKKQIFEISPKKLLKSVKQKFFVPTSVILSDVSLYPLEVPDPQFGNHLTKLPTVTVYV